MTGTGTGAPPVAEGPPPGNVTEVDVTTIAVPKQAEYEETGKVFEQMAFGLLTAADLTRGIDFSPGTFREAQDLQQAVDSFCQDRQDTLEIYSEACVYIGEIIRLCGETYTGSEQQRVEKGSDLDSRIGSALKGLQRLHGELDKVRQRGSAPREPRDREPRYRIMGKIPMGPGPQVDHLNGLGPRTNFTTTSLLATNPAPTTTPEPSPAPIPAPSSQTSTGGSRKG